VQRAAISIVVTSVVSQRALALLAVISIAAVRRRGAG